MPNLNPKPIHYCQWSFRDEPEPLFEIAKPVLLGKMVLPRDGSWAMVLKDGVLYKDSIAFHETKHIWKVIAEKGVFPTEYKYFEHRGGYMPHKANSVMLANPGNPNEYAFSRPEYLDVINDH